MLRGLHDGDLVDDVARLRKALRSVQTAATSLRWAKKRPWLVKTHVRWEAEMPTIDGHDLSAKLMKQSMNVVIKEAKRLDTGAVLVITGRGNRTVGPEPVLPKVMKGVLGPACEEHGWRLRPHGAGAWVLVVDAKKAPRSATGAFGCGTWLLLGFFAACAAAVITKKVGMW
jgi:hypothetical protein